MANNGNNHSSSSHTNLLGPQNQYNHNPLHLRAPSSLLVQQPQLNIILTHTHRANLHLTVMNHQTGLGNVDS